MKERNTIHSLILPNNLIRQQKGASSLEYLMLGAVVIAILVAVSTNTEISGTITETFNSLFTDVQNAASE